MAETIIACVYTPGGDFTPQHVDFLKKQSPWIKCFGIDIPLKYDWPGWWAKMELFRPDIKNDILFFDLDTIIAGDVEKYTNLNETYFLADFYYPEKSIGSGVMYIKNEDKAKVWNEWIHNPEKYMEFYRGDQDFLKQFFWNCKRFQSEFPGKFISYKKHLDKSCAYYDGGHNRENADIICFHGKPRPWELKEKWTKEIYHG